MNTHIACLERGICCGVRGIELMETPVWQSIPSIAEHSSSPILMQHAGDAGCNGFVNTLSLALLLVPLLSLLSGSQSPKSGLPPENRKFYRIQRNGSPIVR
jgi:hypothetical protein